MSLNIEGHFILSNENKKTIRNPDGFFYISE
jgi:hypothetical protein